MGKIRPLIIGLLVVAALLLIFQLGVAVGYHKAKFYPHFGERGFWQHELPGSHGAVGTVVQVSLPTFVVATGEKVEKVVLITDSTLIRHLQAVASSSEIKVGEEVVVIGVPNTTNQIEAKLIRLL